MASVLKAAVIHWGDVNHCEPPGFVPAALKQMPKMILAHISEQASSVGISMGCAIAIVCSWQRNRSILWAIVAAFLSWFYVIYFALTRRPDEM